MRKVKEAQNLQPTFHSSNSTSNLNNQCNSFLRIQLISCTPNIPNLTLYDSEIFPGTSIPLYDKSFSFDISPNDFQKRILISIFHSHDKELELLGCMSFGIKKFINKTQVSGWYYLLQPQIGSRKHLKAGQFSVSRIRSLSGANISGLTTTTVPMTTAGIGISGSSYFPASLDTASTALHTFEVKLMRGQKGFGFTLCGGSPVYVSNVDVDSSAEAAGIHPGDMVLRIDNFSVVESSTETVVRMFRMCPKTVKVTLSRSPVRLPVLCPSSNCCEKATPSSGLPTTRNLMLQQSAVTPSSTTDFADNLTSLSEPAWNFRSQFKQRADSGGGHQKSVHFRGPPDGLPDKAKPPNPQAVTKKEGILCDCHIQSPIDKAQVPPLLPPPPNNSHQGNGHGSSHKLVMSSSHSFQNANIAVGAGCHTNYGRDIVSRLQYQGHLQKVDFGTLSNRLEVSGPVNLREGNSLFPVYVMLFPEVILIGQHEPDGRHITVIKEPIYCANICYVNIPALKRDELILQYINEVGRKQFVHFQSRNIREWLKHIQRHMVYHCNWWMKNVA